MEATKCGGGWGLAMKSYIKGDRERVLANMNLALDTNTHE
jgi:hypothetical protein